MPAILCRFLTSHLSPTALCVPCHQIGETHRDGPPSFVNVANMPSTTALSLKEGRPPRTSLATRFQSSGTVAAFISLMSHLPLTRTRVSSELVCAAILFPTLST